MEDRGVYLVIGFTDEGRSFEYTQEKAQEVEKRLIPLLQAKDSPYSRFIMRVPGFGKSDKYNYKEAYTYANHIDWASQLFDHLQLDNVILFAQDWGGLIGLRLLTAQPDKFSGLIVSNSGLPVGIGATEGFNQWLNYSQTVEDFNSGKIVEIKLI